MLEAVDEVIGELGELGDNQEVIAVELVRFLPLSAAGLVGAADCDRVPITTV